MNFIKLLALCFLITSCAVFGMEENRRSLYNEQIKGDCNSMMEEYYRALGERDGAMKELDYARYSMGRYGSSNAKVDDLERKYKNANDDVMHYEQEVLPLACQGYRRR